MPCTCSSIVKGGCPWKQTPVDSFEWCIPPYNICRCGAPPYTLGEWDVPPHAAPVLGWLLFLPVWSGKQRGKLQCRRIAKAEEQVWGICSGSRRGRSWLTPRSPSGFDVTPWSQRSIYCLGAWLVRGSWTPRRWRGQFGGRHDLSANCWGDQDLLARKQEEFVCKPMPALE